MLYAFAETYNFMDVPLFHLSLGQRIVDLGGIICGSCGDRGARNSALAWNQGIKSDPK
jgi:hypothetical protein